MCRRTLAILLLPAILLTQWVSVNQCVGGCGSASQGGRPHIHLNTQIPDMTRNKACGCQRKYLATDTLAAPYAVSPSTLSVDDPVPCHGTDHDVLYVSLEVSHGAAVSESGCIVGIRTAPRQQPTGLDALFLWTNHQLASAAAISPRPNPRRVLYVLTCSLMI